MGNTVSRRWVWQFDAPRRAIWPLLADTARFNEAAGLPKQLITDLPQPDGSVRFTAEAKVGPFTLIWDEPPVNWVTEQWFEHSRLFRRGPLALLRAHFALADRSDGGCTGTYTLSAAPRTPLGSVLLRTGFFSSTEKNFGRMAQAADAYARGERSTPFDYRAPVLPKDADARLRARTARLSERVGDPALVDRLATYIRGAQAVDLQTIRPLRLAEDWGVPSLTMIELCLEATRAGLLDLQWTLLCPRCRVAKVEVQTLDALPTGAHCSSCNIRYERQFTENVEASFRPNAAIRPLDVGEFCLFGPMSTPHIRVHVTVPAGTTRGLEADLTSGPYRLRTLEPGPETELDWQDGTPENAGFPALIATDSAIRAGAPAEPGTVRLENRSSRPLTFVVEDRRWFNDALTAHRLTCLQVFRDLFSDQVLRPGDDVGIARVTLMFTDLKGSTALYATVGDAPAFRLVRDHFAFLTAIVRRHHGTVVKTIGDAIHAAFADPADGVAAALEMQRSVPDFNQTSRSGPICLRIGVHEGPCIAVTLNDRLDYFGSAVNLAARLEGQSAGGDIVLSGDLARDPGVRRHLEGLGLAEETASLRGFAEPVTFVRVRLADAGVA